MPPNRAPSPTEVFAAIRRDLRAGLSSREIQRTRHVTWRTVKAASQSAWPPPRAEYPQRASKLDPFKPLIEEMLVADLDAPRKQRHTATRIFDRLVDEHQMSGVSYDTLRAYVAKRRPEVRAEQDRGASEVFVPQTHLPGREAEVDFGEISVRLRGDLVSCHLFALRMSYSGKAVHRASATGGQEAFFEGHQHAFRTLGGVPAGKIRYDNLKAAVAQVIGFTRQRVETDRWIAFRSHFDLDAFYCQPGIEGAHEKGGVEGDIGRFRRNHLVPVPEVDSIAELNDLIDGYDTADDARRIGHRLHTVGEAFAAEQTLLKPLPVEPFETGLWLTPRVDRYAQVTVRSNRYSVPSRLIGRPVRVLLNASDLTIYDGRTPTADHQRLLGKGGSRLELDHYLEALIRKPGALPGATALEQARAAGTFTPAHDAWWAAARKAHGDTAGTRALIEVLLLHRHLHADQISAGIRAALQAGAFTADAVALEARKRADTDLQSPVRAPDAHAAPAVGQQSIRSLTEKRLSHLPPDTRPLPDVTSYDQLLTRPKGTP
ncbi:IS21 family transposase [Georgenia sp. Z1344]|uniref:IS21 family transposase n=1 Tax=Georgenia sp. Z1344 TaxID=3416706 RepID=UPI003CED6292